MSDIEQEKQELKSHDLSPAMVEKATQPKKTWFFERFGDGSVFACEEREAWQIVFNKSKWKRRDFKLLGTSDGTTYHRITKESLTEAYALAPNIDSKKKELQRYMKAEEDLIIGEAVDMEGDVTDSFNEANKQKVLRLRKIIDRLNTELDELEVRYKEVTASVVKRATEAELETAKANQAKRLEQGLGFDWPDADLNIQTPAGSHKPRSKILGILGGRT